MTDPRVIPEEDTRDPRRWITLAIVLIAVVIAVMDNTVLNVAIPTILREFHTNLGSLQWVVTGYSLTFATLLIIGGRMGDVYGHRTTFMIGAALFGAGSLIAALSTGVLMLVIGEAVIEGIGAALMMPATLAILSTTFSGQERSTAFAAWGAVGGASAAFGPVIGGFLTTNFSWRWAFGINVIVAPLAITGAALFMHKATTARTAGKVDVPGALLVAGGVFLLVFGISEGGTYGWLHPLKSLTLGALTFWPASRSLSITPVVFMIATVILAIFYVVERRKERLQTGALFEFGQLRHRGFRYGLLTTGVMALAQFGLIFVLPVFLQDGKHLTAWQNGLWNVPSGLFIVLGAQVGGRLTKRMGPTFMVRLGMTLAASGFFAIALAISPQLTLLSLMPGFVLYGIGSGFAQSQLTNVILSDIDPDKAGVASGANTTIRQVAAALGVATMGAIFSAQTIRNVTSGVRSSSLAPAVKAHVLSQVHGQGVSLRPPAGLGAGDAASLQHTIVSALVSGARPALYITSGFAMAGAMLSFLIPKVHPLAVTEGADEAAAVGTFEATQPARVDPELLTETPG